MRLFLKHLFRSIVKKPLQPIILVSTLALSVAICVFSFSIDVLLKEEQNTAQTKKFGTADIQVSLNSTSMTRFVFSERAEELLSGRAKAVGSFEIPLFFGEDKNTAFGVAVDFYDVAEVFDIEFSEYGRVTPSNIVSTMFVSSDFAAKNGFSLGDNVEFEIAGEKKNYEVRGISPDRFLASYDVMVDITGVMRVLVADNLLLSSLGESFKPSSAIYIDLNDGESISEAVAVLRNDEMFSDKEIKNVSEFVVQQANVEPMSISISFAVALAALLCAAVSFSCFYILALCRREENAAFFAAGARRRMLLFAEYIEVVVYWFVGGAIGLLLAFPLISAFMKIADFSYVSPRLDVSGAIKGEVCILLVSLLTVLIFDVSNVASKKNKMAKIRVLPAFIVSLFAFFAFALGTYVMPVNTRIACFALMIISMIVLLFIAVPLLIRGLMTVIANCLEKRRDASNPSLLYAVKNVFSVKILHNTALLVVIALSTMLSLVLVIAGGVESIEYSKKVFRGDYAILNATDACCEKVSESEMISSVHSVYIGTMKESGESFFNAFSTDDPSAFWEGMNLNSLPCGNQAVISWVVAEMLEVNVGDKIYPDLAGDIICLEVTEIVDSSFGFLIFDSEYFGIPKNIIIAKSQDGYSKAELLGDLSGRIALEMATVIPTEELYTEKIKNINVFLQSGKLLIIVLLIFITVGMADNLFESYRAREEEFRMFALAGMGKNQVARMKLYEILITFAFGVIWGGLLMLIMVSSIDSVLQGFGFSPIGNLLMKFR